MSLFVSGCRIGAVSFLALSLALTEIAAQERNDSRPFQTLTPQARLDSITRLYDEILRQQGRLDIYLRMKEQVMASDFLPKYFPPSSEISPHDGRIDQRIRQLAAIYDMAEIERLRGKGVDVLHSFFVNPQQHTPVDFYVTAETLVIGEVVNVEPLTSYDDGFHSTVTVKVVEVLKGTNVADTVFVRQGIVGVAGRATGLPDDLVPFSRGKFDLPKPGMQFLVSLSRQLYPIHAAALSGKFPARDGRLFYIRRHPHPLFPVDGERIKRSIARIGIGVKYPKTLAEIRAIAQRLQ